MKLFMESPLVFGFNKQKTFLKNLSIITLISEDQDLLAKTGFFLNLANDMKCPKIVQKN